MGQILHVKSDTVADITDSNYVRPSDWNSAHAYTLQDAVVIQGNTAGATASISSGTFYLAGGNNITLSQNANSVTISNSAAFMSSYENIPGASLTAMSTISQSISQAVAFNVPYPISFSFLRIPVQMTTNSTLLASSVTANLNMSAEMYSTWNAVIYSVGVGVNSRSLQSLVSGQNLWTFRNSVSVTNSTQCSVTQAFTAYVQGGGTTITTQYSASTSNYPLSTTAFTAVSGNRFIDINFTGSLDVGHYWLVVGVSTTFATNNAAIAGGTNCFVKYSQHFGGFQINSAFGIMGSTDLTSGGLLGAGSFSTVGGGTTNSIPLSAISSSASNNRLYFQLLRSA